jgi:hypothetical protein
MQVCDVLWLNLGDSFDVELQPELRPYALESVRGIVTHRVLRPSHPSPRSSSPWHCIPISRRGHKMRLTLSLAPIGYPDLRIGLRCPSSRPCIARLCGGNRVYHSAYPIQPVRRISTTVVSSQKVILGPPISPEVRNSHITQVRSS